MMIFTENVSIAIIYIFLEMKANSRVEGKYIYS